MQLLLFNTIHSNAWKVCCCFIWNAISQKHLLFLPAALAFQTLFCFSVPCQAFDDHSQSCFSLPLPNLCSLSLFFFLYSHFTFAFLVICGYVLLICWKTLGEDSQNLNSTSSISVNWCNDLDKPSTLSCHLFSHLYNERLWKNKN